MRVGCSHTALRDALFLRPFRACFTSKHTPGIHSLHSHSSFSHFPLPISAFLKDLLLLFDIRLFVFRSSLGEPLCTYCLCGKMIAFRCSAFPDSRQAGVFGPRSWKLISAFRLPTSDFPLPTSLYVSSFQNPKSPPNPVTLRLRFDQYDVYYYGTAPLSRIQTASFAGYRPGDPGDLAS